MKQIWPNYSYSPATNVLTLTGLNIDRDQLLLVTAADRGRIMYNFADSSVTASAFTSGANTALTLVATTAGLTTTAALVIYYDDQLQSTSVSISNLPSTQTIAGTVTANLNASFDGDGGLLVTLQPGLNPSAQLVAGTVTANAFGKSVIGSTSFPIPIIGYDEDITTADFQITVPVQISSLNGSIGSGNPLPISGTVTANISSTVFSNASGEGAIPNEAVAIGWVEETGGGSNFNFASKNNPLPISGTVTIGSALPAGTNRIGVVTIGAGTVTLGASTSQIGSVTASISNSVVTFYPMQGTSVSNTNFTSTTASTTLVSAVANREVLTVFNEGAGNLHISAGATCTTISYQVRLSAGDYWECPQGQLSLAHTAVFATAGTARVTEVS